ncbi:hypothetical protein Anas_05950, partial [Armadillidium nasatum]
LITKALLPPKGEEPTIADKLREKMMAHKNRVSPGLMGKALLSEDTSDENDFENYSSIVTVINSIFIVMKSKKKVETKQKGISLLDQTANDFEDDKVLFRYPKNSVDETQVSDSKLKSRGRPKKSSKTISKIITNVSSGSKSVVNITDLENELSQDVQAVSPVSGQDVKSGSLEDLSELEKSICSESEKLCPSCKHIVLIDEYPNHVSKCLQKFSYTKDKSSSRENISRNLPCPVCLKVFTSTSEKQNHVKMCGFSHGLTPQQLIEANKLQAKQEEERLALGLPSPQVVQSSKDIRKVGLRNQDIY